MPIELSTDLLQEPVASCDTVMACLKRLNSEDGVASVEADQTSRVLEVATMPLSRVVELAAAFGFKAEWNELDWAGLKATGFTAPILALRKDNDAVIVTGGGRADAEEVSIWDPHHDGVVFFVPREDFEQHWNGQALVITRAEANATTGAQLTAAASNDEEVASYPEEVAGALPSHLQSGKLRLSSRLWSLFRRQS
jgi:ABC-type bacteriocin/lantibiotic exporter with double-glycine peptidase domain